MKLASTVMALAVAAALTAACDRPKTGSTAYNNSGNTASPTATTPANPNPVPGTSSSDTSNTTSTAAVTPAPGPGDSSSGAVGDTVTTGKIKAAIASDPGMKDADVSVSTSGGNVTLSGTVKSQDQISLAQGIAQKTEGVQKVDTNITVK